MTIHYYTAVRDILSRGIRAGDTISVDTTNPDEPVVIHHPAVGVSVAMVQDAVAQGLCVPVAPAIPSGVVASSPSPAPSGRPRLRLLRSDEQSA